MTPFPVPGLTAAQRRVFNEIAAGNCVGHHDKPIAKLLEIGAIVVDGTREICRDRFGTVSVPTYGVPIPLHMLWCAWCCENFDESGEPK